jgi:hypothetical protein
MESPSSGWAPGNVTCLPAAACMNGLLDRFSEMLECPRSDQRTWATTDSRDLGYNSSTPIRRLDAVRVTQVMDQRQRFVYDVHCRLLSFSELCRRYAISRKTGYKWLERWLDSGPDGLQDRTSRPGAPPWRRPLRWSKPFLPSAGSTTTTGRRR